MKASSNGIWTMLAFALPWLLGFFALMLLLIFLIPQSSMNYALDQTSSRISGMLELFVIVIPVLLFLFCWWWLSRPSSTGERKILEQATLCASTPDWIDQRPSDTPENMLADAESLSRLGSDSLAVLYKQITTKQALLIAKMQRERDKQHNLVITMSESGASHPSALVSATAIHHAEQHDDDERSAQRLDDQFDQYEESLSIMRGLKQKFDRLDEMRLRIYDGWHHRKIEDKISRLFGNRDRARAFEWFILFLIVIVLIALFIEQFMPQKTPEGLLKEFLYLDTAACIFFLLDFGMRVYFTEDQRWFWKKHWIDLLSSIPLIALVMGMQVVSVTVGGVEQIRIGRMVRLVRLARVLRVPRILALLGRGLRQFERVTEIQIMRKAAIWIILLAWIGGIAVYYGEKQRLNSVTSSNNVTMSRERLENRLDPSIATASESLWWSLTTLSTGGLDLYQPRTPIARIVTVLLILGGAAAVGVFTATLTHIMLGEEADEIRVYTEEIRGRTKKIQGRTREIHKKQEDLEHKQDAHNERLSKLEEAFGSMARARTGSNERRED